VLDENNRIDPDKMDLMGRMGRAYYVRCSGSAIHTIVQNYTPVTIGYDSLPDEIKTSPVLTGNDLGKLAGQANFPTGEEVNAILQDREVQAALHRSPTRESIHYLAKSFMDKDEVSKGFALLLSQS
jgi:hypothetical protein